MVELAISKDGSKQQDAIWSRMATDGAHSVEPPATMDLDQTLVASLRQMTGVALPDAEPESEKPKRA